MTTRRKLFAPVGFKALGADAAPGTFEAIVSVFDNVDAHGDIIRRGTFVEAIKRMKKTKAYWPVVFSHQSWDLDSIMGLTLDAAELKPGDARIPSDASDELKAGGGLWVRGRMSNLDDPFTAKVWDRMKDGRIAQWSYHYDLLDGGPVTIDGNDYFEFRKADILEVGPTIFGANTATRTLAVKARAAGNPRLAKTAALIAEFDALEAELGSDVAEENAEAALAALDAIANANVLDLTDEPNGGREDGDDDGADEVDEERHLATLVAEVVVEVLDRRRSARSAGGRSTVTADDKGKTRGKTVEDRSSGKTAEDRNAEDPAPSPHRQLTELEAIALEVV